VIKVSATPLDGVKVIEPRVFGDDRGWFFECFNADRYHGLGMPEVWAQDNVSCSSRDVVRGLHFQNPTAQSKLVMVLEGDVFDVVVDLRRASPTFGRSFSVILSGKDKMQLFVPEGFAHGFCALSDRALFAYKCSRPYAPADEHGLAWDDPDLAIAWPTRAPTLSDRDKKWPRLRDLPTDQLF
jgi:dTDP-4-dehydrorhamnose 3,5-epimerase